MSEKYEILESIDDTQFGNLSRAYNPDSEKEVLFLQIHNNIRNDKKAIEDVWRLMNIYNELKHPVLPTVLDAIKSQGVIVTDFPSSENLAHFIDKSPISQNAARKILRNILEALVIFEAAPYIHGNISPETIYFDVDNYETSNIVLSFSLGPFILGELLLSNRKSKYLAPEMINDSFGAITPRSDLFCLGFSVFEALVGNEFDSHFQLLGHDQNTLWHVWFGDEAKRLPEPSELIPDLDSDLETVLSAMLQRNARDRLDAASLWAMLKNDETSKTDSTQNNIAETKIPQPENTTKKKKIVFTHQTATKDAYPEMPQPDKKIKTTPKTQPKNTPKNTTKETQQKKEQKSWNLKNLDISLSKLLTYIGIAFVLIIATFIIVNSITSQPSFDELIKNAEEKIANQLFVEALEPLEKAKTFEQIENDQKAKLNFLFVEVYKNIAIEKIAETKYDEAIAELNKAQELPPTDQSQLAELKKLLIQIYLITAEAKIAEAQYIEAQADLDFVTQQEPNDEEQITKLKYLSVKIPLSTAEKKIDQKQYREALIDLDKASNLEPIDEKQKTQLKDFLIQCYLEIAEQDIAKKEFKTALDILNKTKELNPTDKKQKAKLDKLFALLYNNSIKDKIEKKQYAEAFAELESLKNSDILPKKDKAELFYQLAQNYATDKLFPESAKAMDEAMNLDSTYSLKPLPKNDAILVKLAYRQYKPDAEQNTIQWETPSDWKTLELMKEPFEISVSDDFTDDDIFGLYRLSSLQSLNFSVCNAITNTGLRRLKTFRVLRSLEVSSSKIDDEGVKYLGGLTDMEVLSFIGCSQVTSDGIKHLKRVTKLKKLNITGCSVGGDAVSTLNTFSNLETLSFLGNNIITGEAILKLNALKKLRILNVDKCTNIKEDTIKKLREMYPNTTILPRENK
ncbi:MAG: hypothetical protein LBI18_01395 [Planctomycetaceae bacterium]|jgi:serine/threonine protein kinase|nr:hypothetical protein [Planctomycetaceae bacterium]